MTTYFNGFSAATKAANDTISVSRTYIDMCDGNLYDGLVLSQIVYWHSVDKKGTPRLRVERDGHLWLCKSYTEWWDECRVNQATARRSIDRLVKKGLLIKQVWKWNGAPTVHIRINEEEFEKQFSMCAQRTNGSERKAQMKVSAKRRSLTETTTETTSKTKTPASDDGGEVSLTDIEQTIMNLFEKKAVITTTDMNNAIPPGARGRLLGVRRMLIDNGSLVEVENGYALPGTVEPAAVIDIAANLQAAQRAEAMQADEYERAVLDVFKVGGVQNRKIRTLLFHTQGDRGAYYRNRLSAPMTLDDVYAWARWYRLNNPKLSIVTTPEKINGSISAWMAAGKPTGTAAAAKATSILDDAPTMTAEERAAITARAREDKARAMRDARKDAA